MLSCPLLTLTLDQALELPVILLAHILLLFKFIENKKKYKHYGQVLLV